MSEHPNKQPTDRWQRAISDTLESRDMLDVKLGLMRTLRSHLRAPYLVYGSASCLQWRLSDTEDLFVVVDARDVFSSWIAGSGRSPLLEAGTAEQLLDVLTPLLGREAGDTMTSVQEDRRSMNTNKRAESKGAK